jgi:electron transfer flavoprotein beta subunit
MPPTSPTRIIVLIKAVRKLPSAADRLPALAPCDAAALDWALALADDDDEVVVITAGPQSAEPTLDRALARGATRAIRVWVPEPDVQLLDANVRGIAELLAATVRHLGAIDLLICGARSADWSSGITGPAVAFELDIPHISGLSSIERVDDAEGDETSPRRVRVTQHRDARRLECELRLPALLSVVDAPAEPTQRPRPDGDPRVETLLADEVGFEADDPLPWPALPVAVEEGDEARQVDAKELLALLTSGATGKDGAAPR